MNATVFRSRFIRRTVLAHGLLLALSAGVEAGASDPERMSASATGIAGLAGQQESREAIIDAASREWRVARRQHAATPAPAGSVTVSNCNDDGAGSLREAIANAASGDTIDLTSMSCSDITLTTGALVVLQNNLSLQGPTDGITIGADDQSEVFVHIGGGYLSLDHLSIEHGAKYMNAGLASDARGGCIASAGSVALVYSEVTNCAAVTMGPTNVARGGAIYASGGVVITSSLVGGAQALSVIDSAGGAISSPGFVALINSVVTQGFAQAQGGEAHGGGVDVGGVLMAQSSSVVQNLAVTQDYQGSGGGVRAQGTVYITSSSFALNSSMTGGAIEMRGNGYPRSITNCTIAGNAAPGAAGILASGSNVTISNSSIVLNSSGLPGTGSGVFVEGVQIHLESTLIALNGDLDAAAYADVEGSGTLSGSHNLIHTGHIAAPADTIENVDPQIVPVILDTSHVIIQLKPGSAAINAGSNALSLDFDQRGTGFPRQIGAATDIGSFEFDLGDLVFAGSFD